MEHRLNLFEHWNCCHEYLSFLFKKEKKELLFMKSEIEEIYVVYWLYIYIAFRFLYLSIFFLFYAFYLKKEKKFLKNVTLHFM